MCSNESNQNMHAVSDGDAPQDSGTESDAEAKDDSYVASDVKAHQSLPVSYWEDYLLEYESRRIFDEAIGDAADVDINAHWRTFADRFNALGAHELNQRWVNAERTLSDNGVIYNVHALDEINAEHKSVHLDNTEFKAEQGGQTEQRAWKLDPIPMIVPPKEWQQIESAIKQRVKLLNLILDDLYGPQKLIQDGAIPPQLLWGNASFLRPLHGLKTIRDRIVIYAADLGRSHDGKWWFVSDRTQAPSGLGYALENRLVVSRCLPGAFKDCKVQRLAELFQGLQEQLIRMAPHGRDEPTIVVLTPGPYAETYFEHAYLARYLGYPLVEGRDLTVRDNKVYLKSLDGLKQIDVILRRVDDDFCDPLELKGDSALGVTGLVQAIRQGHVAVANQLGTGVVEAAGMMPFLPSLCRKLLGEEEILPSVATWWCGQEKEKAYVLDKLDQLIIKPAMRGLHPRLTGPIFGGELSKIAKEQLIADIHTRPYAYVGQEVIPLSTVPVWQDQQLTPRRIMMRMFGVVQDGRSDVSKGQKHTVVLPGGLTRVASTLDSRVVSMQMGGASKDTWVLTEGEVSQVSLLPQSSKEITLERGGPDIPSRLAEDLYWLGRYIERAHGLARILRTSLTRIYDDSEDVKSIGRLCDAIRMVLHTQEMMSTSQLIEAAICDWSGGKGMLGAARDARVLGAAVREVMSEDAWRVIVRLEKDCHHLARRNTDIGESLELLDDMMATFAAFAGMGDSMTRGHGYWFMELGRRIERASYTCDLCLSLLTADATQQDLISLLQISDSIMTYRSRYRSLISAAAICDLLILDESNPRSLSFQLAEVSQLINQLPMHESPIVGLLEEQKIILRMLSPVRLSSALELCHGDFSTLKDLLEHILLDLPNLSDALTRHYLAHTQSPIPLFKEILDAVDDSSASILGSEMGSGELET